MIVETGHDPQLVREAVTRLAERRVRRIIDAPVAHRQVDLPPELAGTNPVLANAFDAEHELSSFVPDEPGGAEAAGATLLAIVRAPVGFINLAEGDVAGTGPAGRVPRGPGPEAARPVRGQLRDPHRPAGPGRGSATATCGTGRTRSTGTRPLASCSARIRT